MVLLLLIVILAIVYMSYQTGVAGKKFLTRCQSNNNEDTIIQNTHQLFYQYYQYYQIYKYPNQLLQIQKYNIPSLVS